MAITTHENVITPNKKALRRGLTFNAFIIRLSNNPGLEVKIRLHTQDIN